MIGWLWRLIVGRFTSCHHRWVELERINWVHNVTNQLGDQTRVLRCERCGDMKNFRITQ